MGKETENAAGWFSGCVVGALAGFFVGVSLFVVFLGALFGKGPVETASLVWAFFWRIWNASQRDRGC